MEGFRIVPTDEAEGLQHIGFIQAKIQNLELARSTTSEQRTKRHDINTGGRYWGH